MPTPYATRGDIRIYHGDAAAVLSDLDVSATAVVTDPPYGLAFMGRDWDDFEPLEYQSWCKEWAEAVKGSMRPGAPLLAFSGTRTFHRAICGIEDAGFTVKDVLSYLYGSGFPKSHSIDNAIDEQGLDEPTHKQAREELAEEIRRRRKEKGLTQQELGEWFPHHDYVYENWERTDDGFRVPNEEDYEVLVDRLGIPDEYRGMVRAEDKREMISDDGQDRKGDGSVGGLGMRGREWEATTDTAKTWNGYGTALAPSWEPVCYATKPREGTYAENALQHGVAGLNIDNARLEYDGEVKRTEREADGVRDHKNPSGCREANRSSNRPSTPTQKGRWPANVVFDEEAAQGLDAEVGARGQSHSPAQQVNNQKSGYNGSLVGTRPERGYKDTGGPSRYFYTSKASKSDRNAGLPPGEENDFPTVKPTDLIGWLLRLVEMPEENLILDPFCGSGTTLYVAQQMGLPAIGIDQSEESCELAAKRLSSPSLFS